MGFDLYNWPLAREMSSSTNVRYSAEEKACILQQLDRLLANIHFSNSKRFPSFLRFIVGEELDGRGEQLKERQVGIAVFERQASYDTTSDPIVRVTAAEIRKRIAQYYQESGHAGELRISLPPGSYVPHFEWPESEGDSTAAIVEESLAPVFPLQSISGITAEAKPAERPYLRMRPALVAVCVSILLLAAVGLLWMRSRSSALDRFWSPIFSSSGDSVIVCFPQAHLSGITLRDANDPSQQHQLQEGMSALTVDDLRPLVSLAGLLERRHQRYTLLGEDAATLTDLRQGPAIFVGAFDNAWTLRFTHNLRFRFANDPEMSHFWIEDTQSPTHTRWSIDRHQQESTNNYRDYAIVARFHDASTGKPTIIAAGVARGGTVAAGEFLTQPGNMESLIEQAPNNWDSKNMELVLSTEIIDGRSAPPKIEAAYFW
jgi:hypothetical protein